MQFTVPSVDEFVDLDTFLDSYLTQLHNDTNRTGSGALLGGQQSMQGMQSQLLGGAGGTGLGSLLQPMQSPAPPANMGYDPVNPGQQGSLMGQLHGMGMQGMQGMSGVQGMSGIQGMQGDMQQSGMQGGMQGNFGSGGGGGAGGLAGFGGPGGFVGGLPPSLAGMPGLAGLMALQQQQQQQQQQMQMLQPRGGAVTAGKGGHAGAGTKAGGARGGGRGGRSGGGNKTTRGKSEAEPSSSEHLGETSDSGSSDGAGGEKPRKKQMTTDEAERRHQALQEKNRRAQRRFRERQKTKLTDLHKQIEELTTRVSSLQNENSALHSRTSILEKVLDMRNEQIQVMQETKESNQYPGNEEELLQLQDMGGQLVQLSPEMIKELSSDQIYKIYQMYVKELSNQLNDHPVLTNGQEGSVDTSPPPAPELEKLVKDLSMMIMRLGVIKPLETRKFIVVSRQYLGSSEAEVIELWKNVMRAIDLSDQQKREVVELKRMFLQKIEPIMEERKHLNVQIQANLPHDTFHTKNALTYIKAHEAVIKLRDNLRAEQHVVLEFAIAVFRGVFRPRQMATLLVKCYPAVPDALGIASALAAELGEPDSPAARALALQLGGYLENNGGGTLGTNYMTLHPTLHPAMQPPQQPLGPNNPQAQQALMPRPNPLAGTAVGALAGPIRVGGGAVAPAGAGGGLLGAGQAGAGMADQFGHWMARPAGAGELMTLAASGTAPIVSLLQGQPSVQASPGGAR